MSVRGSVASGRTGRTAGKGPITPGTASNAAGSVKGAFGKKDEVYGYETVFRELGYYITRMEHYERALKAFDEAIKKTPTDKRALMGRSWARAKAVQYQGALNDINKALQLDSDDLIVLAHKALNTYLSCEFEDALVQNLRRVPIRKKPDSFVMGVMHCTEAIENCLGKRAGRPLRDHFKIIRKLAWKKAREAKKPYEPLSKKKKRKKKKKGEEAKHKNLEPVTPVKMKHLKTVKMSTDAFDEIPAGSESELAIRDSLYSHKSEQDYIPPAPPFPYRPLQNYTSNIENYVAEKYLDKLYLDKIFLKQLKTHPGLACPNYDGVKKIIKLTKEGFKTLNYKQELLRTRRPFYFIKYQETRLSGRLRQKEEDETSKKQETYSKDAEAILLRLEDEVEEQKAKQALETADKLLSFCGKTPKKYLPKRDLYLKQMYKLVGRLFLDLKRINHTQYDWIQEKRICAMLGIPPDRIPSNDSVLNQFKGVFVDYKKQVQIAEDRLRKATSCEELAWLYHELSRFHLELKQLELARVYARKCMTEGYRINNLDWVINAMMLVTKVNVLQHNRNDARSEVNDALKVAYRMQNKVLIEYLQRTLITIEKIDFDDVHGAKIVEKREKQIIAMMAESGMKEEVSHLFRKMSAMPAARRMSVMPGIKFVDTSEKPNRKQSIKGPTKAESEEEKLPKIKDSKEEGKGGVGFMELIEFHVD